MIGRMLSKGLLVPVILLFIGHAVQPAFAVTTDTSDNENDCDICPKVSKQHIIRLKSLINRLEKYENLLPVLSKYDSKVAEKYKELSDEITNLKYDLEEKFPIICSFFRELSSIIWTSALIINLILVIVKGDLLVGKFLQIFVFSSVFVLVMLYSILFKIYDLICQ